MEAESITSVMAVLALQLGIIFFAVRIFGRLAKKAGAPQVLGELVAGIIIGPFALGGITLPGFPHGIFPLGSGTLSVSSELYAFAVIASIILLFASGLETNIRLFLRYSFRGGLISLGGVVASFAAGAMVGMLMFQTSFTDPRSLFLGVLVASNSLGIVARLLSDQKKMDTPESVTIMAASVFDDVLSIIVLAVVLGIVAVIGNGDHTNGLSAQGILIIAGRVFGIWLVCMALALIFSKRLSMFLKKFKSSFDFSILALGLALLLAGIFERLGLAMIIGAYIAGLSLSKTDIAPLIQDRIRVVYDLFVPVFFAVTGMMVNYRDIISLPVLAFGALYAAAAIAAKLAGCGSIALLLGFNTKGALRIGLGMAPRGEMTLIIAGIGLAMGILAQQLFAVLILMILITTVVVPPLLTIMLKLPGHGTRKPPKEEGAASFTWEFPSAEIAYLIVNTLRHNLRSEGFYVQSMNLEEGLCQARKDDIFLSIYEKENTVTIETSADYIRLTKIAVYEVIAELYESVYKLKQTSGTATLKKDLLDTPGRISDNLLLHIRPECIKLGLSGKTKIEIITELVDLLNAQGRLLDRDMVYANVLDREKVIGTGIGHGVAMPHAKTDGVEGLEVAIGITKEGVGFGATDEKKARIIILVVSPQKSPGPHLEFLSAIYTVLQDGDLREALINAESPQQAASLLHKGE